MKSLFKFPFVKAIAYTLHHFYKSFYFNPFKLLQSLNWYIRDLKCFQSSNHNPNALITYHNLQPELKDRTDTTPVEPIYFLQDTWAAKNIFSYKPKKHVDVASQIKTIGIISQFVPTTFIDIRPPDIQVDGLTFQEGSIVELPFEDSSVESLSSICVLEHIGLGRYGDPIDPYGSEKAFKEVIRVLKPGGHLLISVPVENVSRTHFNAHRTFSPDLIRELTQGLIIKEEKFIYGRKILQAFDPTQEGVGLYHFVKPANKSKK